MSNRKPSMTVGEIIEIYDVTTSNTIYAKIIEFDPYYVIFKTRSSTKGRFSAKLRRWSRRKFFSSRKMAELDAIPF